MLRGAGWLDLNICRKTSDATYLGEGGMVRARRTLSVQLFLYSEVSSRESENVLEGLFTIGHNYKGGLLVTLRHQMFATCSGFFHNDSVEAS